MAARKQREADPMTQLRRLEASLAEGPPARAYLLRGEERYFRERGIELVRRRARELDYDVSSYDTNDPDFDRGRLLDDLAGGSLFANARCVVVRNATPLLKKEGKQQGAFVRALQAFLASGELAGCVVIAADSVRADHAAAKAVAAAGGTLITCRRLWDSPPPWRPDPRQAELVLWLVDRARELGVPLRPDQAVYVAAATGNDLHALEAQLEKIRLSPGAELKRLVGWESGATPFAVADALCGGDPRRSLSGIEALFRGGFQERDGKRLLDRDALVAILVGVLAQKLRQTLAGALAAEAGGDPVEGAGRAGAAPPPRQRDAFAARARSRRPAEWRRMLEDVAQVDRKQKRGGAVDANDFALLALRWRARA